MCCNAELNYVDARLHGVMPHIQIRDHWMMAGFIPGSALGKRIFNLSTAEIPRGNLFERVYYQEIHHQTTVDEHKLVCIEHRREHL
jgi:hypothetical protein